MFIVKLFIALILGALQENVAARISINDVFWMEGVSLATEDGCEWRLKRYDNSKPSPFVARELDFGKAFTPADFPLNDSSLFGYRPKYNQENFPRVNLITREYPRVVYEPSYFFYEKVKVCEDTPMYCTSELIVHENMRIDSTKFPLHAVGIPKWDCVERLNHVNLKAHTAMYNDELNRCTFYEDTPIKFSSRPSSWDSYQKVSTCTKEYVEKDHTVTCATTKFSGHKSASSRNAILTWTSGYENRRIAAFKCKDGYSFVHYRNRSSLLLSVDYLCHPQRTQMYISTIFGHYAPKCVKPEGRADRRGRCPLGQRLQLFKETRDGEEYLACFKSPPGYYVKDPNARWPRFNRCLRGTYSNEAGATECKPCPAELAHLCEWAGKYDLDVSVLTPPTSPPTTTNHIQIDARSEDEYCRYVEREFGEKPHWACHDRQEASIGHRYCILQSDVCDCFKHCKDNSDELYCEAEYARKGITPCRTDKRCYRTVEDRCDCKFQCYDGSDEEGCPKDNCKVCSDGRTTYTESQVCNCRKDCPDGADERNCPNTPGAARYHCRDGTCHRNGRCNGKRECAGGEDERNCGRRIQCYSCSGVIYVNGNGINTGEDCVNGIYEQRHRTQTCYNYCTLIVAGEYRSNTVRVTVRRGCMRLLRDRNKRVDRNSCYDLKQESDVRRLISKGEYPSTGFRAHYHLQTCSTRFCNDRLGYELDLCGEVGVGALKARISSAQSIVPSAFSYYLAIVLGYCPIVELYNVNN